jgi:hypothetical protein
MMFFILMNPNEKFLSLTLIQKGFLERGLSILAFLYPL